MAIVSIILCGLAVGVMSLAALQIRQQYQQRNQVKERFLKGSMGQGKPKAPPIRLPFISKALEKQRVEQLALRAEAELPRLLDILAMGMHAGLSFDAAFGLYVRRFDTELALLCRERFELWERGLISRNEGLEKLAAQIKLPLFERFCRMATRSIRYGVPMAPLIHEYATQARTEYRNKQKEKVLKAPVKMLLPTGVLILPAMMLLVLGPIVLDVTERMV